MRLTERDRKLLAKLAGARWLTTRQVASLCFPAGTLEPARRRLRLLGQAGYVHSVQSNRMAEALHGLGPKGRTLLKERGWSRALRLERTAPVNLEHFLGINDIRVAVERCVEKDRLELGFFYACWELQQHGWAYALIPDAACHIERQGASATILFEYDRGTESPRYVVEQKLRPYIQGFEGFPFTLLVVVIETPDRLDQLREYTAGRVDTEKVCFILRESFLDSWNPEGLIA